MSGSFRSSRDSDFLDLRNSTEEVKVMDKPGFATYSTTEAILSRKEMRLANKMAIRISASTRRLLRLAAKQQRTLARIERLRRHRASKLANAENRALLHAIKARNRAAKRKPHLRVRTRSTRGYQALPRMTWRMNNGATYMYPPSGWNAVLGEEGNMTDYSPIARLNPPRNITWANRSRSNSLLSSAKLEIKSPQLKIVIPKCKYGALGLLKYPLGLDLSKNLTMDQAEVNKALIKVQAKIYAADIQLNEYLFEWKQVFRLLVDPYRTLLRMHSLLERWTRRNAWIWIPDRTLRRCGQGKLVSKTPLGGMLMSMRTKKLVSPMGVSKTVLTEACNRWLQYRYGIAPLALDITTVMGDWAHPKLQFPKKSESARNWVSRTKVTSDYTYTVTPAAFQFKVVKTTGLYYSVKQWYDLLEEPPMSYKLGMHPSQWIKAIWNGLPWSFVADWVVNIDDYLTATTDVPWIQLGANVCTLKQFESVRSRCTGIFYYASPYYPFVMDGDAIASAYAEKMYRNIDFPRAYEPVMSKAWQTVKNAITALTLIPKPVNGKTYRYPGWDKVLKF